MSYFESTILPITFVIVVSAVIIIHLIDYKNWTKFKKKEFQTAKVSDNLGNTYHRIVAKNNNGEFKELSDFKIDNFLRPSYFDSAKKNFLSKEVAEQELKKFLVHIGQEDYRKTIKINSY